jgi:hypothetical protein
MAQFTLTATDTVPRSSSLTGTVTAFTTSRVIEGSGTKFLSEVSGADWIYDSSNGEIRQVDYVVSDTEINLMTAFATGFTGASVKVAKGNKRQISIGAKGGDITIIDGEDNTSAIVDGSSLTPEGNKYKRVNPIIVQATSAATAYCSTTP